MEDNYLDGLNIVQRQAATHTEGPVLVVAGPGSGKTRVLTYRVAHLLEKGVKPWEILMLTFTNKAAKEMKERIHKVVGPSADKVWAGTFHSIFSKILRVEAEKIGYPSNFTVYDTEDSKGLLGSIIKEMNLDKQVYSINSVLSRISSAKSNIIPPTRYAENEELLQQDKLSKRPLLYKIYANYVTRCKRAGVMDFDDLLYRLYELWHKNPDGVLDKYRAKFKYVLVDEFQDTNFLQYKIVQKLVKYEGSPCNVCVVGDDAQSIYAFRGANIQNILDFEADFKTNGIQIFKLEQNYRSTDHIVQAANELITFNMRQIPKTIRSEKGVGQRIRLIKALTDTEEGKRVADAILEQKNRYHLGNKDIAILFRTNAQSRIFEEYLRRYNISYKLVGGTSFYQRKEVKDLIAYLRLAVNPKDEEALRRVINHPKRSIGDTSVDKIAEIAEQQQVTLWEALPLANLGGKTQSSLNDFIRLIQSFVKKATDTNAYEAASFVATESKLTSLMKLDTTPEGVDRLDNLNSLLDGIKEFVESDLEEAIEVNDKSLASYLQNIALVTSLDESKSGDDSVTLMSVHAAKGLEFASVFVVGMEEDLFPSFMSKDNAEGLDEERRLFYVAITRAEAFLTLTYAASRYKNGKMRYLEASRFLEEISAAHYDTDLALKSKSSEIASNFNVATPTRASVQGNFKKKPTSAVPAIDPSTFVPSPSDQIEVGHKVLHLIFGEGSVKNIDGQRDKRVATIVFPHLDEPEKRIMLKFAKLHIVEH
ncbi:MAG: UvrD-helicase domain-containing protein [Saprospiraceae bacterium]|nr:UvrD-helicase domain-containing protein [Saprospiraceae bacterium]